MLRFKFLISVILSFCVLTTNASDVVKTGNMVTIQTESPQVDGPKIVCLQVVDDNIIRVRATCESVLPDKKSLIVVPQKTTSRFEVSEDAQKVHVKAKNVQAVVDKKSGDVAFYDANGKQLLKEARHGKTFRRFRVPERELGVCQRDLSEEEPR